MDSPEWIPDYEEGDVLCGSATQDGVAVGLDHVTVGEDEGFAIERFLACNGRWGWVSEEERCHDMGDVQVGSAGP